MRARDGSAGAPGRRPRTSRAVGRCWPGLVGLAALALAGCASVTVQPAAPLTAPHPADWVPPDSAGIRADPGAGAGAAGEAVLSATVAPAQRWWEQFGNPALTARVEVSLRAHPAVEGARASLRAARASLAAQYGAWWPQVQPSAGVSRNRTATGAFAPATGSGDAAYTVVTAQLAVSYAPDVFGANARAVEGLQAQVRLADLQAQAVRLTLAANVAAAAIQQAALTESLALAEAALADAQSLLGMVQDQQRAGQLAEADVLAQQQAVLAAQAGVPPLRRSLAQTLDLASALQGQAPADGVLPAPVLASLPVFDRLALGVPSGLLERRPDVAAAAAAVEAASAAVGQAQAARLPQLVLGGQLGNSSTRLADLFAPGRSFWSLGAGVAASVFDGGTLRARQQLAAAQLQGAQAQYRQVALNAFQGVADALQAWEQDRAAWLLARQQEVAAEQAQALLEGQRRFGQVAAPAVVQGHLQLLLARAQQVAARQQVLLDQVLVCQAVAGGPPDADAAPPVALTR